MTTNPMVGDGFAQALYRCPALRDITPQNREAAQAAHAELMRQIPPGGEELAQLSAAMRERGISVVNGIVQLSQGYRKD